MSYTVQQVIDKASQDVRLQVASTVGSITAIALIDYADRIQKQMLRFSRWHFIVSEPQYFMTTFGQTDYWIGAALSLPNGTVDSGLHLTDVDRLQLNSVRDMSNDRLLIGLKSQPLGPTLNFQSGESRPGLPAVFWHDHNDPFVLHLYPGANNENTFTPFPQPPILSTSVSGALPLREYFVRTTFVDSVGGESAGSSVTSSSYVPANSVITVATPTLLFNKTANGVTYSSYNIYASTTEGSETLQNTSPIALGTNWTEPTSGLTTTGASIPSTSTIAEMEGYIIQFRYYKSRITLNSAGQFIQIPDDYVDVMVHGIQSLAWKLIGRSQEASETAALYRAGLTEMIWDKNLFPATDFIRPDQASFVNDQLNGYIPPFF